MSLMVITYYYLLMNGRPEDSDDDDSDDDKDKDKDNTNNKH